MEGSWHAGSRKKRMWEETVVTEKRGNIGPMVMAVCNAKQVGVCTNVRTCQRDVFPTLTTQRRALLGAILRCVRSGMVRNVCSHAWMGKMFIELHLAVFH